MSRGKNPYNVTEKQVNKIMRNLHQIYRTILICRDIPKKAA